MVDSSKRRSLKAIGVMMAAPLVPATLLANNSTPTMDASSISVGGNEELSITLDLNGAPTMQVTNNSSSLTILRRINPNVAVAGNKTYDLNHSLYSSAHAISAGETRSFAIAPIDSSVANPKFAATYPRKQMRLAALEINSQDGTTLNASKAFFS